MKILRQKEILFFKKKHIRIRRKTINPLPDDKISDWSKLLQIADDILKCI